MEQLEGGRVGLILKRGEQVHRPAGPWTEEIHRFLQHLKSEEFHGAPEALGFDDEGNEIVSFLPGMVSNYPLSDNAASEEALTSSAKLLRAYHDASERFVTPESGSLPWQLPARVPMEVICHGDYAPYNVVLQGTQVVGIIDFDTAHPGPRTWDIAYALYRWAPLTHPKNDDGFGSIDEQIARACLFCDIYGLSQKERIGLADLVAERLQVLVNFMTSQAENGEENFQTNLEDGHHLLYLEDIAYIKKHRSQIEGALLSHC